MAAEQRVDLGGQTLHLLGQRAVFWPGEQAMLIADLHLGKADVLRRAGILAPRGTTSADLERLQGLIAHHRPSSVWILGDMLHGPLRDAPWLQRWWCFCRAHPDLAIRVIAGNHDRALDAAELGIERIDGVATHGGLLLCHQPPAAAAATPYLCGHLHPCIRLPGVPRRWPAFRLDRQGLILPAFSLLTGGGLMNRRDGAQWHACVAGEIVCLPPAGRRRAASAPPGRGGSG